MKQKGVFVDLIPFNQTGLEVTPIGLGLAALGRPGYINLGHASDLGHDYDVASMESHAHSVLDTAWDNGIRYFDAARSYGRAEVFLSSWLRGRGIRPSEVVVGSKWGYTYVAGWQVEVDKHEIKDHSLSVFRRQIEESLDLLGDYLDLYQIHSATLDSGVLDDWQVLEALGSLRDGGIVVGLSLSGPNQARTLRKAMAIELGGKPLFGSVQATWNLLTREATGALREAHDFGLGVIIKEALANGRLTIRNDDPGFSAKKRLLEQIAAELNVTIDAVALGFVLAQPWVDIVLSGAAQSGHLLSNIRALHIDWTDVLTDLLANLVEPAEQYWAVRSGLDWN